MATVSSDVIGNMRATLPAVCPYCGASVEMRRESGMVTEDGDVVFPETHISAVVTFLHLPSWASSPEERVERTVGLVREQVEDFVSDSVGWLEGFAELWVSCKARSERKPAKPEPAKARLRLSSLSS